MWEVTISKRKKQLNLKLSSFTIASYSVSGKASVWAGEVICE